jgi:aerobic-type carbon monoxide dehydrogenase small subunit (CoxS/CutS family)
MSVTISTKINGQSVIASAEASTSLLEFLRDTLEMKGSTFAATRASAAPARLFIMASPSTRA